MWHIHGAGRPFRPVDAQVHVPMRPDLQRGERARTPIDARVHGSGSVQMEEILVLHLIAVKVILTRRLIGTSVYNISIGLIMLHLRALSEFVLTIWPPVASCVRSYLYFVLVSNKEYVFCSMHCKKNFIISIFHSTLQSHWKVG